MTPDPLDPRDPADPRDPRALSNVGFSLREADILRECETLSVLLHRNCQNRLVKCQLENANIYKHNVKYHIVQMK